MERTYKSWKEWAGPSLQKEYTEETPLLGPDGTLLCAGWARKNVFRYDRDAVKHVMRRKEWDFYQISDGRLMLQVSFANISLGGYASLVLVDLREGGTLVSDMAPFLGGKDRYVLPARGDVPNRVRFRVGKALFEVDTGEALKTIRYENRDVSCEMRVHIPAGLENITTVLPFRGYPDRYFMTTKQSCMPCEGKAHKIGAVDVETFPKPDRWMEPWRFISEDGRFRLTMTPGYDHHSDLNVLVMRMHSHQVHGLWNGTVTLDDGRVLEVRDLPAFCEYVENRW